MPEQPSYATDGAVRGTGPLSGSGSWRDPDEEPGLGLFEKWGREARSGDVPEPDQRAQSGGRKTQAIGKRVAVQVYELYWTTPKSQRDVGEMFDLDHRTVSHIANRDGHFREKTAGIAAKLGHPDREER